MPAPKTAWACHPENVMTQAMNHTDAAIELGIAIGRVANGCDESIVDNLTMTQAQMGKVAVEQRGMRATIEGDGHARGVVLRVVK